MTAELPDGWSSVPLRAMVARTLGGDWGKGEGESHDHSVRVAIVRGTEFRSWDTSRAQNAAVRFLKPQSVERRRLALGDLVVEVSGGGPNQPVGRVVLIDERALRSVPGPLVCSNFCRQIRLAEGVAPEFIELQLRLARLRGDMDSIQTQTTNLRNLDFGRFLELPMALPPLTEQMRIVERIGALLNNVTTAREGLIHVLEILRRFRRSLLAAACSGRLTEDWRADSPLAVPADGQGRFATGLPPMWKPLRLGDLAAIGTGATPLRKRLDYYGGAIPWLKSACVNRDPVLQAQDFITDLAIAETNAKVFPAGTLLMAMYGEGATRGMVTELAIPAATNQALAAIVLPAERADLRSYLKLALRAEYQAHRALSAGGVQPNLSLSLIREIVIPVPPPAERNEIVRRVATLFQLADAIEAQLNATAHYVARLPVAILTKACCGQLLPTTADLSAARSE